MVKENFNNNIETEQDNKSFSQKLRNFKYAIIMTLWMTPGLLSGQTTTPIDTTKTKTEVVTTTDEILSPEKILEKYKITDVETATIEQLKNCYQELDGLLRNKNSQIIWEERKPYVMLRWKIKKRIYKIESQIETNRLDEEVEISTKIVESLRWKKKE